MVFSWAYDETISVPSHTQKNPGRKALPCEAHVKTAKATMKMGLIEAYVQLIYIL